MKDTDKVIHLNERQNRIMEIMRQQNAVSVATLSSPLWPNGSKCRR